MDELINTAEQINLKIRFGLDAIKKARSQGKDVGEWEKIINDLENQLDRVTEEIYKRGWHDRNSKTG